jgi:hypothetical protein
MIGFDSCCLTLGLLARVSGVQPNFTRGLFTQKPHMIPRGPEHLNKTN